MRKTIRVHERVPRQWGDISAEHRDAIAVRDGVGRGESRLGVSDAARCTAGG